jgi:hypothetical protein
VVTFTPRSLYPQGKSPRYPLDRRLGGPQSRSERGGEEKNPQPLPGIEPPTIQPVAQRCTTELSRPLVYKIVSKIFRTGRLEPKLQMVQLSATRRSCIAIFVSRSSEFCRHNPLCCFSTSVHCCCLFRYRLIPETFGYISVASHRCNFFPYQNTTTN